MNYTWIIFTLVASFVIGPNISHAEGVSSSKPTVKSTKGAPKKKKVLKSAPKAKKSVPLEKATVANNKSRSSWIDELKKKLAKSRARQNQIVAVAAVRGSETPETPPLYWKGKTMEGTITSTELSDFDQALEKASEGKTEESLVQLQTFITKYPQSPMVLEAHEAMDHLKETPVQP